MKKLVHIALTLAIVLGLAACGGGERNGAPPLYGTFMVEAMAEAGAFSEELEELDADTAFILYRLADSGLSQEDVKECAVLRSAGATCEEGAVLVFTSGDKAETAEAALKDYVQSQIDANTDYRPEEIPKLENAYIDRRGESLLLVVANDLDTAKEALT